MSPAWRLRRRAHLSKALKVVRSQAQQDLHAVVLVESHHARIADAHLKHAKERVLKRHDEGRMMKEGYSGACHGLLSSRNHGVVVVL